MRAALVSLSLCVVGLACAPRPAPSSDRAGAGIDTLNARLADAYQRRDPEGYAALFTDSAAFEWPALAAVRGPTALAAMVRDLWATQRDVELRLRVAARRLAADHATEFGAFDLSWSDTSGVRRTEYGRYATLLVRQPDGSWRMDRWLGFEDSTRVAAGGR